MPMVSLSLTKYALITFLVSFILTVMGLLRLLEPFAGDQAMFVVYAEEINRGALLYRDVWDLKQPGIFLFYLIGGRLFGFTEFGIHLFELLYWLVFSLTLSVTLKDYFRYPPFALLTPLLTVGMYYVICGSWHLTQVEGLVGFPLYLTLWAAVKAAQTKRKLTNTFLLFLSGFAGGIVLVFKLILFPIVAFFWLTLLFFLVARRDVFLRRVLFLAVLTILFGLAIPLVAVLGFFALHNALATVSYTFFEYPAKAVRAFADRDRLAVLKQGLRWFVTAFLPLLILTFVWALIAVKKIKDSNKDLPKGLMHKVRAIDLLTVNLISWLCIGFGAILMQRLSWWEYHYLLLLVPLSILATKGIEVLWDQAVYFNVFFAKPFGRMVFTIFILLLFTLNIKLLAGRTKNTLISRMNLSAEETWMPRGDTNDPYERIRRETNFLFEQNSYPGRIFVCGQPLYYYLSKRSPALASNGWMPELFLSEQWKQLNEELAKKTPVYFVVDNDCRGIMVEKSPETLQFINNKYHLRKRGANADWYEFVTEP
jgi:hypothetical protein